MSLRAVSEILDAAAHLPDGSRLVIPEVEWDDYECLLESLGERSHLRVSYDSGRLDIVSPLPKHERYARFVDALVRAYADAQDLELENLGQTTWKRKALRKGAEPDACYYVSNAERIIGKDVIDLESDPPPDIVVEIDTTSLSLQKLHIYAALLVPEVWRYDGRHVHLYELRGEVYAPISNSRFLPHITGSLLAEFMEVSRTRGQKTALRQFRQRIQSLQKTL